MRNFMLALAVGLAAGAPAYAASQEKTEWKETKKDKKKVDKYLKKYTKAIEKGKTDKYDADIKEWAKRGLGGLRAVGIKTRKPAPQPQHPAEVPVPEPASETPWWDALVQALKDTRDTSGKPKMRKAALKRVAKMYGTWEDRRAKKL